MRQKNKGFTLVELLASLVIMSLLAMFALPTVVNLLGNSRDKLYITDAKKLISQAEYKFRVASTEIEKPDDGDCLVLSMVYLDNSDFDNPPNNGKYIREASYVVVKNNNGNFEFSAELVEEVKKGVYKGVELTRDSNLKTSSVRHVVSFSKDDLNFVEDNVVMGSYDGKHLNSNYINSKLGNSYVSTISKVYNYPDLADSTYNSNYAIPKISRVEYVSASNKNFNSLDTVLKIVAKDMDTKTEDLEVIIGPGSEGRYPDINSPHCDINQPYNFSSCRYSYGLLDDFSLNVDFSQIGLDYSGVTTSLYIVIVDPEGNADRINPIYTIHTNEAPVIDLNKSGVFKKSTDNHNFSSAVFRLVATDDSTPPGDLEYCITENKNATSCDTGYKKYSDFVNNEIEYEFKCGGTCEYKGATLNLKLFLRDTDTSRPLETTKVFNYQLFDNEKPSITSISLEKEDLDFLENNSYVSLTTNVKLVIADSSSENNIVIRMSESADFSNNTVSLKYSDFLSGDVSYTFSGDYDGSEKILYIEITDEFGEVSPYNYTYGNVYENKEAEISEISFESVDILTNVCPTTKLCDKYPNAGGAYAFNVTVTASDDLVSEENLLICISDKESDCNNKDNGNFKPYNSGRTKYINLGSGKFNGQEKPIYVVVYDGYASDSSGNSSLAKYAKKSLNYQIYQNQPPEINEDEITIVSDNIDYMFRDVKVSFKVKDDLDAVNALKYTLTDGVNTVNGNITATSGDELNVVSFSFGGSYDGEDKTLTITVEDSYGATSSVNKIYSMHGNQPPDISYVTVKSSGDPPCSSAACSGRNGLKTNVTLNIKDDLDSNIGDLGICLRVGAGECNDFVALKDYPGGKKDNSGDYVLPYTITLSDSYPYKGNNLKIYAYVKDSNGAVGNNSGDYVLYENQKAVIEVDYPTVKSSNDNDLVRLSTFNFKLKASDDFLDNSSLKYNVCYVESPTDSLSSAKCLNEDGLYDYVPDANGVSSLDLELPIDSTGGYNGKVFYLFAKVYDNYAQDCYADSSKCKAGEDYISYSSLIYYNVYKDVSPVINKFQVNRPNNTTSYSKLNVEFNVTDPLDNYQYCISENGISEEGLSKEEINNAYALQCTNYSSTIYDGNSTTDVKFDYNTNWTTFDNSRSYLLYLYIKDSYGNITVATSFPDRVPCSAVFGSNDEVLDSGIVLESAVYDLKSGSSELTAAKCGYKCYHSDETANIKAYYKRTVTYVDKDDSSVVCNKENDDNYEVYCNFRTCFKNNSGEYKVTAIGYVTHTNNGSSPFSHNYGGSNHVPDYYRLEYTTDYDSKSDSIILTPTGNKICGKCFDDGVYNKTVVASDSSSSN